MSTVLEWVAYAVMLVAAVTAVVAVVATFSSGTFKLIRGMSQGTASREQIQALEELAPYYTEVRAQAKVSFWFSLIFASVGFVVILVAALLPPLTNGEIQYGPLLGGVVIDAVAALFFARAKRAQNSMEQFFDKQRADRHVEQLRAYAETITDPEAKDALKVELSLYAAGIANADSVARDILAWRHRQDDVTRPKAAVRGGQDAAA